MKAQSQLSRAAFRGQMSHLLDSNVEEKDKVLFAQRSRKAWRRYWKSVDVAQGF